MPFGLFANLNKAINSHAPTPFKTIQDQLARKYDKGDHTTRKDEKRKLAKRYRASRSGQVGETGIGWDKFWLGQCPSVPNESKYGNTNDVFGDHMTTAFTGPTRIIDARFASEISPK